MENIHLNINLPPPRTIKRIKNLILARNERYPYISLSLSQTITLAISHYKTTHTYTSNPSLQAFLANK